MNDESLDELDSDNSSEEEHVGNYDNQETISVVNKPFFLEQEKAVTLKKNYILYLSGISEGSENRVALGLASGEAYVYSIGSSLICTSKLPSQSKPAINVRFAPDNPSLLYVGCNKGTITLWDLRDSTKFSQQYKDTSDPKKNNLHEKNFCSFDVNCTGRFLCVGTEVVDGDAFLLFWDTRQNSLLGGYWDCHQDDITQVTFHPSEADRLLTGSTDGLINLFDVSQMEEDEALSQSFNTESSVEKLRWHVGESETISCITHPADTQLWRTDDVAPYQTFSRSAIGTTLQIPDNVYIADVHSTSQADRLLILAGSNGSSHGRCLRSALYHDGKLTPHSSFNGNKQIVRCSWFDSQKEVLVTGGESGILSIWKPGTNQNMHSPNLLKASSMLKEKTHNIKLRPY